MVRPRTVYQSLWSGPAVNLWRVASIGYYDGMVDDLRSSAADEYLDPTDPGIVELLLECAVLSRHQAADQATMRADLLPAPLPVPAVLWRSTTPQNRDPDPPPVILTHTLTRAANAPGLCRVAA